VLDYVKIEALSAISSKMVAFLLAFACLTFAIPVADASAQSRTCRSLQAQLASIETGRGAKPSKRFIKYDRAVRNQSVQIKKTERASRKNGCNLLRTNRCERINSSLSKMYANLNALKRARNKAAPRQGSRADRAKILRAIQRNGCNTDNVRTASRQKPSASGRRTLLEQIFGTKTYSDEGATTLVNPDLKRRSGTYRTLCVRTCDGYYFPISFSTTKKRFQSDAEQCAQMCPGTETALFYHPMPGGDAETSISYRTGNEYSSLQNAFSYRKNVNTECSCRFKKGAFEEIAGTQKPEEVEIAAAKPKIGTPQFRDDIGLDEETIELMAGGLTLAKLADISNGEALAEAVNQEIRIVGPAFFPVQ